MIALHPKEILNLKPLLLVELIKYDDILFVKQNLSLERYTKMKENHSLENIEGIVNHFHLYDLFDQVNEEISEEEYLKVGEFIRDIWTHKFAIDYPDDKVTVKLSNNENDYGPILSIING